jgi:hypothetical protein
MALGGTNDAMVALAPASCVAIPGSVPPQYSFDRHDYFWLAMSLSAYNVANAPGLSLDYVHYGTHTLTWQSMHDVLAAALAAGFDVPAPFDISVAVRAALIWSVAHYAVLRRLTPADFEPLPLMPPAPQPRWWLSIPFSSWAVDGTLHPLCHAIGFAGSFWSPATRDDQSRMHWSLLLTQEFIPVSSTMPVALYGDPAIQFYVATVPPHAFLQFPTGLLRLHSAMTVRWGYHNGTSTQVQSALVSLMPSIIREFPGLSRFLNPAPSVAAQVSAYRVLANLLAPTSD